MDAGPSVLTSWSFEPFQLVPAAAVALLYARRAQILRRRGTPVPVRRASLFGLALALAVLALASPLDAFAEEEFLFAHMTQHIVLGDLAPLAFVAGLTGPLLRPVLALPLLGRLRVLAHPLLALPLWALNLSVWHVPLLYQAALHHDALHALQHLTFFASGALMWAAVLEPLPGPAWFGTGWKLGYVVAVRLFETVLGNVFLWSGTVFYPHYVHAEERFGISPPADQGIAGAVMMIEGSLVTIGALAWLFLRLAAEGELRQQLLERGLDPEAVRRAVRYGRGQELSDAR